MKTQFVVVFALAMLAGSFTLSAQSAEKGAFKVTFFSEKKPDLSQEEFVDLILTQHVPLVLKIPNMRGYVQNFVEPGSNSKIDLVTEIWFDSQEDFMAGMQSEEGQTAVADAPNMVIPSAIVPNAKELPSFASDEVQLVYPPMLEGESDRHKIIYLIKKTSVVSWEQMELTMLKQVAPHVIALQGLQGYTLDMPLAKDENQPVHAMTSLWFATKTAAEKGHQSPSAEQVHYYQNQVVQDDQIISLPVTEYVLQQPPYRQKEQIK